MLKRSIFTYLFVFTALILLYQLVNSNRTFTALIAKTQQQEREIAALNRTIDSLQLRLQDEP
jgi:hypothetical protein